MRLNFIILTLTILIGALLTWWFNQKPASPVATHPPEIVDLVTVKDGYIVPDFLFTDIRGNKHRMAELRGHVVILNFWASWCAPCVIEFPKLATLAQQNPDLIVVALSGDTSSENIHKFLKKYPGKSDNFYVAHDVRRKIATDIFQTFKLPETIIIDQQGRMVRKVLGDTDWLGPDMAVFLQDLQKKSPDSPLGSPTLKD